MKYAAFPDFKGMAEMLALWAQLKAERRASGVRRPLREAEKALRKAVDTLRRLPEDPCLRRREPDGLAEIRALRPRGPRRLGPPPQGGEYQDRLAGALLGRMAGCTLGAPVEFWSIERMKALADENKEPFPPVHYWRRVPDPRSLRYETSPREAYTRGKMKGVPVDDDIIYTLLGLLIVEEFGPEFTTADVGRAWVKYLPIACTAEEVALRNLKAGLPWNRAGEVDNPYCEWIGAAIRADPWGYLAPGWPEKAADMAYRDAFLSHRRQGIYGEMFFATAIAAAFRLDDPLEALRIGLTEIPRECAFARAIRWALQTAPKIRDYRQARAAVDARFKGMNPVHVTLNACLTVFALAIGKTDFDRVIGEAVAMGLDNDCNAATAGSLVGAVIGQKKIPRRWTIPFHDTIHSYLIGHPRFSIRDVIRRFERQVNHVRN